MEMKTNENPDLKKERQSCSFNKEELTNLIDGGPHQTNDRRQIESFILSDPDLKDPIPLEYLSHADRYSAEVKKSCLLMAKLRQASARQDLSSIKKSSSLDGIELGNLVGRDGQPLGLHVLMFVPTLMGQASTEQQRRWLQRAVNLNIIGTYAQTELGHGTFLRGLETRATYDLDTKEFVLETPSISSYKWWPGGLGKTANYAIVMAQLYTKGKCEGIHPFMVQLRDEITHEPLPGIILGEIGALMGLNANGSGYLGLDKVRIPRDQMLMKHSQVLEDGTYVKPKSGRMNYATMVFVRVRLVREMAAQLRKAVTIAIRYSCVRHQSELSPGQPEPQIIEYQAQQNKLFPALAATFAFHFSAEQIKNLYLLTQEDPKLLPELHALSCALKALSTSETAKFVEVLRRSCGGHGYMMSSNFPRIYSQVTAAETYEGENTVMWLQSARFLVKNEADRASLLSNFTKGFSDLNQIVGLFQQVSFKLIDVAVREVEQRVGKGEALHDAWNHSALTLIEAAQSFARFRVADCYVQSVTKCDTSEPIRRILTQLCHLFLIYWINDRNGDFILYAGLSKDDLTQLRTFYLGLLEAIRPEALNIVDAFDLRDEILNSTLGAWDGNVYQRLLNSAAQSPLNKEPVHQESFEKYLRPLMMAGSSSKL